MIFSFRFKGMTNIDDNYGFACSKDFQDFYEEYKTVLAKRQGRWETNILNDDKAKSEKILKRFVRKGIPPEIRKEYWLKISGAEDQQKEHPNGYSTWKQEEKDSKLQIEVDKDLERTYPENKYFRNGNQEEFLGKLKNVLLVLGHRNPDIGYCQGFNFVAANLLLTVGDEEKVYWLMQCLIDKILPKDYYAKDMLALQVEQQVLSTLVLKKMPKIGKHLQRFDINYALFSTKWFICLFCDVLPIETANRVFDCLFNEGNKILVRVGLALVKLLGPDLLKADSFPDVISQFKKVEDDKRSLNCHEFMIAVFKDSGSLSKKDLEKLRLECLKTVGGS
ncbi:unnamed protein product [Dimorphilus gyrociliatus]|uniref:Rab-GAP TBC domain-containing protein n=1 Tax=Dimorphilus gyrociliatus TaxID=2664684 RepID=A0A7I8V903_9ANNE|nr:unnamed protein product [Dimorphilus gyrociliatus]